MLLFFYLVSSLLNYYHNYMRERVVCFQLQEAEIACLRSRQVKCYVLCNKKGASFDGISCDFWALPFLGFFLSHD